MSRNIVVSLSSLAVCFASWAAAQGPQPGVAPQQQASPFQLSPAYQQWLDKVLTQWEADSQKVDNFYCDFDRRMHNIMGPSDGRPFAEEKGKLGYNKPDRGSFQITESKVWTPKSQPANPNQLPTQEPNQPAGSYEIRKDANGNPEPGEHWVCNGQNIYEYRQHDKKLVVRPIPANMQGKQIVNGPLPFLFGAEADKLKKRFWLEPAKELCGGSNIGIHAKPKFQADAAEYSDVWVVLRNEPGKPLMPAGIRILHPNQSWDEYVFHLKDAQVNARLAGLFADLFKEPRTPWGWERIVEQIPPDAQAQQPGETQQR